MPNYYYRTHLEVSIYKKKDYVHNLLDNTNKPKLVELTKQE